MANEKQFVELITSNQGIIHKVARMYFSNATDQDDLFQEIVLQLWRAYPSFRGEAKFTTWMYRVALNTAISVFKKEKRKQYDNEHIDLPNVGDIQQESTLERKEEVNHLYKAIDTLSATDKAIVLLHLDGYGNQEIADVIGITEINVRVKLSRIRKKLKKMMV